MIDRYFYLIWTGLFFLIWLALFLHRKDLRKEMLFMGGLFGIGGILSQYVYLIDWWKPITIIGTLIGFEDFFIGVFIGGIAAVVYEEVYHKKERRKCKNFLLRNVIITGVLIGCCFFGSFFLLNLNSFYSSVLAFTIPTFFILSKRKDLIKYSFVSGILMLLIGVAVYFILFLVTPDYFHKFWYLRDG